MSYEIKPLKYEDLDRVYPEEEKDAIGRITKDRQNWMQCMHGSNWAVDEQTGVFLTHLPGVRLDAAYRYLFGMPGGVALIRNEGYCLYSFLYVSPSLLDRMEEVKNRIREIFKMAGVEIDGVTDEESVFAVPNAQFEDRTGNKK
nr:hypothetical protein [uncultured Roseateles sp.]